MTSKKKGISPLTDVQVDIVPRIKRYSLVFDKRVVNPNTFQSYSYGYEKKITILDEDLSQAQAAEEDGFPTL